MIHLPLSVFEWDEVNAGFCAKSIHDIIHDVFLAVDGYFQRTNEPTQKEVGNQTAYFLGHYQSYGVNCQAAVQSDLWFRYFGVIAPGSTNGFVSYSMVQALKEAIDNLLIGRYALMDAAYDLSKRTLVPFTGTDRQLQEGSIQLLPVAAPHPGGSGLWLVRWKVAHAQREGGRINQADFRGVDGVRQTAQLCDCSTNDRGESSRQRGPCQGSQSPLRHGIPTYDPG